MIDNFAILIFGIAVICVVYKAARLDKTLPWFQPILNKENDKKKNIPARNDFK
jgi:hypothetical protein